MLQLPDEIVEDVIAQAIVHAGDVTACSLALVSRRMHALSFAPRWRLVHLLSANVIYRFAVLLGKLSKKGRVPPVRALLLWMPETIYVDQRVWAPRGLKQALRGMYRVDQPRPGPGSPIKQGQDVLQWAAARVLAILSPQLLRLGTVISVRNLPLAPPLLTTHFPVLEELAVSILNPMTTGLGWLSAAALPRVRRLHFELCNCIATVDWRALKALTPVLTHLRLSGLLPKAVPELIAGPSPLPLGVRRVVFKPSPSDWNLRPYCDHGEGEAHALARRRINDLVEGVRERLRVNGGELAPHVALLGWQGGPHVPCKSAVAMGAVAGGVEIAQEFDSIRGERLQYWGESDWDEGQLVWGREMDEALVAMAGEFWLQTCYIPDLSRVDRVCAV
jgi:hypothetical protein